MTMVIGVLHPGEMGAGLARRLGERGHSLLWASPGRAEATRRRAEAAGLEDAGSLAALLERSEVVISICPPHAATDVARSVAGYRGVYVDMNAVAPATVRAIATLIAAGGGRFADGAVIGPPPRDSPATRLYLSGPAAEEVGAAFEHTGIHVFALDGGVGAASAMKMAFAAWTKGTSALLLAIRALARAEGVEDALVDEWATWPWELGEKSRAAGASAITKGWRWSGEMEEIARTMESVGMPGGFHTAAAEIYRRIPRQDAEDALAAALESLRRQ